MAEVIGGGAAEKPDAEAKPKTLGDWYRQELDQITPKYEAAEKEARGSLERRKAQLADFKTQMGQAPGPPQAPDYSAPPQAPTIQARPFLDSAPGEPWQQSLQKLMLGTGLMAQMAVGIKGGFPQGALAAYTGALNGWAKGDAIRGANEWHTYLGHLKQYEGEVRATQAKFDNAMTTYGHQQDRLKTEFGILAAEQGLDREGIELAFREPDRLLQNLTSGVKILELMEKDAGNVAWKNLMYMQQQDRDAETSRHNRAMEKLKGEQKSDKLRFAPAGGAYYDKGSKQMLPAVPEGDFREAPQNFKSLAHQDIQLIDFIDTTKPQITRLKDLASRLAAQHPGMNMIRALELAGQGRLAMSEDLREAVALNRDLMVEMTRALGGGGQLRVTLLKALEKDVGWKQTDTTDTAARALVTVETALENRKRGILGEPLVQYGSRESAAPNNKGSETDPLGIRK